MISFNVGSDWTVYGRNFFEWMDYLTSNVMLPVGGILIAIYAGWMVKRSVLEDQADMGNGWLFKSWLWLVRLLVPAAVFLILLHGFGWV